MKKILVIYYTQSGQAKAIVDKALSPLIANDDYKIDYFKIIPKKDFPFPWTSDQFYDCMPECVSGEVIPVNTFDINGTYDLVIMSLQVWFLSPSIPFWSMLQDEKLKMFLHGKMVITVFGVRNMWVNAQDRLIKYFKENKVNYIGNMVFADPHANLLSVITVIKFITTGKKKASKYLPAYGVSDSDIDRLHVFGELIDEAFANNNWEDFQVKVVENKGVAIKYSLMVTELAASRIFKLWSAFIRKKGKAGDPKRRPRLKIYQFYLLFLLFFISPFSSTIFNIINFIFRPFTKKSLDKIALIKME